MPVDAGHAAATGFGALLIGLVLLVAGLAAAWSRVPSPTVERSWYRES